MITHQCEACGKSEDVTEKGKPPTNEEFRRLCYDCARAYRTLAGEADTETRTNLKDRLAELKENMVTEVRKKRGIEPFDQKFKIGSVNARQKALRDQHLAEAKSFWPDDIGEVTLQHRLDYWRRTKVSTNYPQQGKALDILLADIVERLEFFGKVVKLDEQ